MNHKTRWAAWLARARCDKGTVIAEFAMMLPVFMIIAFGVIDIQWCTRDAQAIEYIVTESARCEAIGAPLCATQTATLNYAMQLAVNMHLPMQSSQIGVLPCSALSCKVSIVYPFKPLGPWFPKITISRTGESAVPPAP